MLIFILKLRRYYVENGKWSSGMLKTTDALSATHKHAGSSLEFSFHHDGQLKKIFFQRLFGFRVRIIDFVSRLEGGSENCSGNCSVPVSNQYSC